MYRLLWHRRDLRLHDNELYCTGACKIYSLFIFEPSNYSPRPTGIVDDNGGQLLSITHGPHYTRRLLDAVLSLRLSLQSLGGKLIVREGNPLDIIPNLAKKLQVKEVAWSEIPGYYECDQSEKLKDILMRCGYQCYTTCSLTLVHPDDLPKDQSIWNRLARPKEKRNRQKSEPIADADSPTEMLNDGEFSCTLTNVSPTRFAGMPIIMGDFLRVARTSAPIRDLYPEPDPGHIARDFSGLDAGDIPSLEELTQPLLDTNFPLLGCLPKHLIQKLVQSSKEIPRNRSIDKEQQSQKHLNDFVQNHAASANRSLCDVSNNDSSKLSVVLGLGILSPQQVYHCVKQYLNELETQQANLSWLISHMEMRDFFLFDCFRKGRSVYRLQPAKPIHKATPPQEWLALCKNQDNFIRWAGGQTNLPLVDAGMAELIATGYTSNRVRQNMASLLTKDLKLDWRLGAEWMQLCLEDHCVAANFGNWIYFAGVGGDPKNRHFRTVSQAWRYDPEGKYVRKWISRLGDCNEEGVEEVLRPWAIRDDWCAPIVRPETQLTWQDREKLTNTGRIS